MVAAEAKEAEEAAVVRLRCPSLPSEELVDGPDMPLASLALPRSPPSHLDA